MPLLSGMPVEFEIGKGKGKPDDGQAYAYRVKLLPFEELCQYYQFSDPIQSMNGLT